MKALNFIIIKLTIFLVIGILLAHFRDVNIMLVASVLFGCVLLSFVALLLEKKSTHKKLWFGLLSYIAMIAIGAFTYMTHDHQNFRNHYTKKYILEDNVDFQIQIKISKRLKPTQFYEKFEVDLISINNISVTGCALLNINKTKDSVLHGVDDILHIQSNFSPIQQPLNPNQFNYKKYLEKHYIFHQIFTQPEYVRTLSSKKHTIFGFADQLRQHINRKLTTFNFEPEELAIINALILGQRQDIDRNTYTNYSNAGAIHILAVSGLHVGIVLLLLNFILKPIEKIKGGHYFKLIIIVTLLWCFAVIAGLSASVTRAVTMFSIVAIAMHLKRPTNIFNTLSISIFILLLFKPMFLFDVGFQMSYTAVFAIVSIQPLISKIWYPKWKISNYLWQIFTVTLSAQIGVLPISLFYFHQFPGLFFISNMAIIPFLGIILGLGILLIILVTLDCLPEFLAQFYGEVISLMNDVVAFVADQNTFIIKDISFDVTHLVSTYLLIIALVSVYKNFKFKQIAFFLVSVLLFQSSFIYIKHKHPSNKFIVFHKSRQSILALHNKDKLSIWHSLNDSLVLKDGSINNYRVGNFIRYINVDTLSNIYKTQGKSLLVVDSLGVYNVSFSTNFVLLRNSPKVNLERLIDALQPELIIADGSNYKSYVKRWEATCKKAKLPFHYTYEKGAFIID